MAGSSIPVPGGLGATEVAAAEAEGTWLEVLHSWVVTVDHKKLGIMYVLYALLFLVIGGIEAIIIRIQLFFPDNHFVSAETFNRMFTMHGTTMIFFVAMPITFGFGNYLLPLMLGVRDMAFPRLNAFGFWMSAFGGLLLYYSFIGGVGLQGAGSAPDVGWWAYSPLDVARLLARPLYRLLGDFADRLGLRLDRSGHQFHCYSLLHALQGHDAISHAAAGLALCGAVVSHSPCGKSAHRSAGHADD